MSTNNPEIARLQAEVDALKRLHAQPIGDAAQFSALQLKAQRAFEAVGDSVPAPLPGETLVPFQRRLIDGLKHLSARWKAVPLSGINDSSTLDGILGDVCDDAQRTAANPAHFPPGTMRPVVHNDAAGRPITRYVGHPSACWDQFNPAFRYVRGGVNGFSRPR